MSTIIAGHFDQAVRGLAAQGFAESEYVVYFLNPPGQHDLTPIGGDAHSDEGAREAGKGAVAGATVGGAVGLAVGGAVGLLNTAGAREIERSEGRWADGEWKDFDPRRPTETLKGTTARNRPPPQG